MIETFDYNTYFKKVQDSYKCALGKYLTKIEFAFINKQLDSFKNKKIKILDVGGGDGRHAAVLVSSGYHVDILEYDDPPIRELKKRNYKYKIVKGDGNKLSNYFPKNKYDVILAIQLDACTDKKHFKNFLSQVFDTLKDDGIFIFTGTNTFSIFGLIRLLSSRSRNPTPFWKIYDRTYFYMKKNTKKYFDIIEMKGYRFAPVRRFSDNLTVIKFFEWFEKFFFLYKLPFAAPWILFSVKKNKIL